MAGSGPRLSSLLVEGVIAGWPPRSFDVDRVSWVHGVCSGSWSAVFLGLRMCSVLATALWSSGYARSTGFVLLFCRPWYIFQI